MICVTCVTSNMHSKVYVVQKTFWTKICVHVFVFTGENFLFLFISKISRLFLADANRQKSIHPRMLKI